MHASRTMVRIESMDAKKKKYRLYAPRTMVRIESMDAKKKEYGL